VPYYWNIAPNMDFTFEPTEYTRRGIDLGGDLRFLTEAQHGELTGTTCRTTTGWRQPQPRAAV
jgi:LPS-assembly protein